MQNSCEDVPGQILDHAIVSLISYCAVFDLIFPIYCRFLKDFQDFLDVGSIYRAGLTNHVPVLDLGSALSGPILVRDKISEFA